MASQVIKRWDLGSGKKRSRSIGKNKSNKLQRRYPPTKIYTFPRYFGDQPMRKFCRFVYSKTIDKSVSANTVTVTEFRANDLYDPEVAVGGHQPYGFDQVMGSYEHFTVLRSVISVQCLSTDLVNMTAGIALAGDSGHVAAAYASNSLGLDGILEMPASAKTLIVGTPVGTQGTRTTKLAFNAAKFFGRSEESLIGASDYRGDYAHSPAEMAYFTVWQTSPIGAAVNSRIFNVQIVYYAVFTEPAWFGTSS